MPVLEYREIGMPPIDFSFDKPPPASQEAFEPIIADMQKARELQVRTGKLDEVTWDTAFMSRVPRTLAGQATISASDLLSHYGANEQLPPAHETVTEAFSPAANNGYRADRIAKKISQPAFEGLFEYTQALANATGKPVAAVQTRDYTDVATLFRLQPGMRKEDYVRNAGELLEAARLTLSEDPRNPTMYTVGSMETEEYIMEDRLPSDVDVVIVVDKADNPDNYQPSPLIRCEQYEDAAENPYGTQNKPVQRYLSAATLRRLSEHAERTGVSLHLVLYTRQMWNKLEATNPSFPGYTGEIEAA